MPAESGNTDVPPKATLFCPDCDYRSHVSNDWRAGASGATRRVRCPACGTRVDGSDRPGIGWPTAVTAAMTRSVASWTAFWIRATTPW